MKRLHVDEPGLPNNDYMRKAAANWTKQKGADAAPRSADGKKKVAPAKKRPSKKQVVEENESDAE